MLTCIKNMISIYEEKKRRACFAIFEGKKNNGNPIIAFFLNKT